MNEQIKNVGTQKPSINEPSQQIMVASTGQRVGNLFFDIIFYHIFAFFLAFILALTGSVNVVEGINDPVLRVIICLVYFVPQEALSGRTLGKLITGTRAVNEDGSDLTVGRAFGRTLCRFIPFEAFSFLGGQGRPKGWHDRIPKTKVISIR